MVDVRYISVGDTVTFSDEAGLKVRSIDHREYVTEIRFVKVDFHYDGLFSSGGVRLYPADRPSIVGVESPPK